MKNCESVDMSQHFENLLNNGVKKIRLKLKEDDIFKKVMTQANFNKGKRSFSKKEKGDVPEFHKPRKRNYQSSSNVFKRPTKPNNTNSNNPQTLLLKRNKRNYQSFNNLKPKAKQDHQHTNPKKQNDRICKGFPDYENIFKTVDPNRIMKGIKSKSKSKIGFDKNEQQGSILPFNSKSFVKPNQSIPRRRKKPVESRVTQIDIKKAVQQSIDAQYPAMSARPRGRVGYHNSITSRGEGYYKKYQN
jgi:hypothetical protein